MNEAQWTALDAYVADLAQRMRLWHWKFTVLREHCGDDANADIWKRDDKNDANIRVAVGFAGQTSEERRYTLVHELLHAHFADMPVAVDLAQNIMGNGAAFKMLTEAHMHAEEKAADAIAQVLAPFMPPCELPESTDAV